MILLLGRCGLERVAGPLRALGHEVALAAPEDLDLLDRLRPALIYADLFADPPHAPAPPRAALARALPPGAVLRAPRLPVPEADRALLAGRPVVDPLALWARHGILSDAVRFGPGHGEAEHGELGRSRLDGRDAGEIEAQAVHARWHARHGRPRKVVVVDLDDTLIHGEIAAPDFAARNPAWGGDGPLEEAWWRAPRGLHLALRELQGRGLLLALATRNEPAVLDRLRRRPGALLSPLLDREDFAVIEAHLGEKSGSLRRIAAGLGLGTDSLVLVDDSPFERAEVAAHLPEVLLFDSATAAWRLPEAPELWVEPGAALDRRSSYQSRAAVARAAEEAASPADLAAFLHGLELRAVLRPATEADLPRVGELFLRSHQLCLNAARPAPASPEGLWVATLRDRLADHGLVAAGLVQAGPPPRLLAFAGSCRVLPHRVMGTLLGALLARHPGIQARYEPTGRNGAAAGLLDEAARGPAPWLRLQVVEGA